MTLNKNLWVLPTGKPSRLFINPIWEHQLRFVKNELIEKKHKERLPQNIYITNDEDINENDYIITKDGRLVEVSYLLSKDLQGASKIILTTDQDLIKNGVQAIDDEFLEWFVQNPSCEEVEVVKTAPIRPFGSLYKIIIPKGKAKVLSKNGNELFFDEQGNLIKDLPKVGTNEFNDLASACFGRQVKIIGDVVTFDSESVKEEPKQETLEEAFGRIFDSLDYILFDFTSFEQGAKWQQERSYSEEEVKNIVDETIEKFYKHFYTLTKAEMKEQWFEQFKKK